MHLLIAALLAWNSWHTSAIVQDHGYPVFTVGRKPFFVYGAAFFYERIPRSQWRPSLDAYKAMGINTIDLYVIWNWHQPSGNASADFTGKTDPRRDLVGLLQLIHERGFKVVLRPGPVIRNEWRNGGYPGWLLVRPEYNMPLRDVLEGRYPATATLQNAHADTAATEWLANSTHLHYASRWLHDALTAVAPYSRDVIAIALDDDQGAYIDNDTYPAPRWHQYIQWLRSTVASVVGNRVPLFLNTFEMKVPAAAPAWSWGNWYQSDAYSIGAHDLAELDFATGLLQTQPHVPLMQAEFQAGWLQGADEGEPRPADPTNTTLALNELLRQGMHGIVNFPVQDTVYPAGWEVPWANWSYAWDAALTSRLERSMRYAPTAQFASDVSLYGARLARTHPVVDAAIVWPPSLFSAGSLSNARFAAFKDATIAMQRECADRRLTCSLVDLRYEDSATLRRIQHFLLPVSDYPSLPRWIAKRVITTPAYVRPHLAGASDATLLIADDESFGFVDVINPSSTTRRTGPIRVTVGKASLTLPAFSLNARSARLLPILVPHMSGRRVLAGSATPPPFADATGITFHNNAGLFVTYAPGAGARIASLTDDRGWNAASSIGLLRDAVDPQPPPSTRDYIAAYTHPLPVGTFNRAYDCSGVETLLRLEQRCTYEAPDIPDGGATFRRTMTLDKKGNELVVHLVFQPKASLGTTRLESISGFAFAAGDSLIAPDGAFGLGILHGERLASLRWRAGDVARVDLRHTRGAEIVALVFAKPQAELRLGFFAHMDAEKAETLLRANRPDSSP
jgi:glycosyl hydrolase family 35